MRPQPPPGLVQIWEVPGIRINVSVDLDGQLTILFGDSMHLSEISLDVSTIPSTLVCH